MDVLAASEKNMSALRLAAELGGVSLKNGETDITFDQSFRERKFKKKHPFELEIKNTLSGATLYIHPGDVHITDDVEELGYGTDFTPIPLSALHSTSIFPSGTWDVMIGIEVKTESVEGGQKYRRVPPTLFFVKRGKENDEDPGIQNYIKDGNHLPSTNGLAIRRIGSIEKKIYPGVITELSAYWEIRNQDLENDLDIYFYNSRKEFSIICSLTDEFKHGLDIYPSGEFTPSLTDYTFRCNAGWVNLMGNQIRVEAEELGADEFPLNTNTMYAYLSLDTENLSAFTNFTSTADIDMFTSGGFYNQYLGYVEAAIISGQPIVRCISQWQGPIYIPVLIPSGQNMLFGDNHRIEAVPLSAGFPAITAESLPSGTAYGVTFVPSGQCE